MNDMSCHCKNEYNTMQTSTCTNLFIKLEAIQW